MKKRQTKFLLSLFVCAMWLTALAQPVKASQVNIGEIPVTIDLGDSLTGEEFEIELKAEDSANPMPVGSKDGVYTVIITGGSTSNLPKIDYTSVGTYTYTISQKIENDELYDYDTKVYLLKVEVFRSQTTGGLQAVSTMYALGQSAKVAGAVFYNAPTPTHTEPSKPTKTDTGVKPAFAEIPRTSDEVVIWPYVGSLVSGVVLIVVIGLDKMEKTNKQTR